MFTFKRLRDSDVHESSLRRLVCVFSNQVSPNFYRNRVLRVRGDPSTLNSLTSQENNRTPSGTPPIPSTLTVDTKLKMRSIDLSSHDTKPPSHLAEHELVSLMERHGVGTDASMATHIGNIQSRNYVTLGQDRRLIPTEMGLTLVHGYLQIDPELVLPRVRASIEEECSRIGRGEASPRDVVEYVVFEREAREFQSFHFFMFQLYRSNYENITRISHS